MNALTNAVLALTSAVMFCAFAYLAAYLDDREPLASALFKVCCIGSIVSVFCYSLAATVGGWSE